MTAGPFGFPCGPALSVSANRSHQLTNTTMGITSTSDFALVAQLAAIAKPGSFPARLAADLTVGISRYRSLTPKQRDLTERLIREETERAQRASEAHTPSESFPGIRALFAKATEALKNPKVRFATDDGVGIVLNLAGAQSKAPGTIHVTGVGSFESRAYFGKIDLQGAFTPGRAATPQVVAALRALDANPAEAAAAYGRKTGVCSCCGRELTDPVSVERGIGPICIEKFGL